MEHEKMICDCSPANKCNNWLKNVICESLFRKINATFAAPIYTESVFRRV